MELQAVVGRALACTVVTGLALSGAGAPVAAAPKEEPPGDFLFFDRVDEQRSFSSLDEEAGFPCDDFEVLVTEVVKGTVSERPAPDGTRLFHLRLHGTNTFSANGHTFTEHFSVNVVERVTESADGTLSITGQGAGGARYLLDGERILRDPGMNRYEITITDPGTEDEVFVFTQVKESTGLNETQGRDFCEDLVQFLGTP